MLLFLFSIVSYDPGEPMVVMFFHVSSVPKISVQASKVSRAFYGVQFQSYVHTKSKIILNIQSTHIKSFMLRQCREGEGHFSPS